MTNPRTPPPGFADDWEPRWLNGHVTCFIEAGLTYYDTMWWWPQRSARVPARDLAALARDYLDAGFTTLEAIAWHRVRWPADRAARWANEGWQPSHVMQLGHTLDAGTGSSQSLAEMLDADRFGPWFRTGIAPHRVLRYAAAGIHPTEALVLEACRESGENIDGPLATLAALRAHPSTLAVLRAYDPTDRT